MKLTQSLLLGIASLPVIYGAAIPAAAHPNKAAAAKYDTYAIPKVGYGTYPDMAPRSYTTYARRKRAAEAKAKAVAAAEAQGPYTTYDEYAPSPYESYNDYNEYKREAEAEPQVNGGHGARPPTEPDYDGYLTYKREAVAEAHGDDYGEAAKAAENAKRDAQGGWDPDDDRPAYAYEDYDK